MTIDEAQEIASKMVNPRFVAADNSRFAVDFKGDADPQNHGTIVCNAIPGLRYYDALLVAGVVIAPFVADKFYKIVELEKQQTPRLMREAALGIDGGRLKALDDKITALRTL